VGTTPMRRAAGLLLRAAAVVLVATAAGAQDAARAAEPQVSIARPLNGSVSNDATPSFSGFAEEGAGAVTLTIYQGPTVEGSAVQSKGTELIFGGRWSLPPFKPLPDGTYTALATQTNSLHETGRSAPVTFTVDTAPPVVVLSAPPSPSSDATPTFTGTASETTPVTVLIEPGAEGPIVASATATGTGTGAAWTSDAAGPALANGRYTAVAIQESSLGNAAGESAAVSFTVTPAPVIAPLAPLPASPPAASFRWLPAAPRTGETITLVSTSTDAAAPLTASAWALAGNGVFSPGESTLSTSFATPGGHLVQLRVTDAKGLSSIAARTIPVTTPPPSLMQPFPVVRVVGFAGAAGTRIATLSVLAPVGATVRVSCRGGGCPARSQRLRANANGRTGTVLVTFHRFERTLRPGAVLTLWIYRDGRIGKFTRLVIRRARPPARTDLCVNPAGTAPLLCP
jgi:large repetitive protein